MELEFYNEEIMKEVTKTEVEQVIKARIGQGLFKKVLIKRRSTCDLCGVGDKRLLIASHIKPWRESSDVERLDPNNGLLFCPNHDSLFDKGFITFNDEGIIIISPTVKEPNRMFLNITADMKIHLNSEQQKYMQWHREKVYLSDAIDV